MVDGITYDDVMEYDYLFTIAPAFVFKMMANTNSNLVSKFRSTVQYYMGELTEDQRCKLDIILSSDVDDLQAIMDESYRKTNKEQYKILADPNNREFIEKNLAELRAMI